MCPRKAKKSKAQKLKKTEHERKKGPRQREGVERLKQTIGVGFGDKTKE